MLANFKLKILASLAIIFFISCATVPAREDPKLEVVSDVDINRYLGRWYEIARYPNWFQEDCYAVTADYELTKSGSVKVTNRCREGGLNGKIREAVGLADVADENTNAKLRVTFYWPFYGKYWIIALGDNYEYAVVSEPKRQYLWILSRKPTLNPSRYNQLTEALRNQGFDISFLISTPQK